MTNTLKSLKTGGSITALLLVGSLNMGNQSCATPPPTEGARILKMDTTIGEVNAQKITMPSGEIVDFPYIANALFYGEVLNSDHMTVASPLPVVPPKAVSSAAVNSNLDKQVAVLRSYGLVSAQFVSEVPMEHYSGIHMMDAASPASPTDITCTYSTPEFSVGGDVLDFTASAGGGLDIGFGKAPSTTGTIGINYSQTALSLRLRLDRPLTQLPLQIGDATSYQKSISANLGFGQLGLNFFFTSAISDAIRTAMDSALSNIITAYATARNTDWNQDWESRVVYCQNCDNDTHIAIRGGAQNGIKVGDTFSISNLNYQWVGSPCSSRLVSSIPDNPSIPTAKGVVQYVDDNFSVLGNMTYSGDSKIRVGAKVSLSSFVTLALALERDDMADEVRAMAKRLLGV